MQQQQPFACHHPAAPADVALARPLTAAAAACAVACAADGSHGAATRCCPLAQKTCCSRRRCIAMEHGGGSMQADRCRKRHQCCGLVQHRETAKPVPACNACSRTSSLAAQCDGCCCCNCSCTSSSPCRLLVPQCQRPRKLCNECCLGHWPLPPGLLQRLMLASCCSVPDHFQCPQLPALQTPACPLRLTAVHHRMLPLRSCSPACWQTEPRRPLCVTAP
jgi:hypothetical protein